MDAKKNAKLFDEFLNYIYIVHVENFLPWLCKDFTHSINVNNVSKTLFEL